MTKPTLNNVETIQQSSEWLQNWAETEKPKFAERTEDSKISYGKLDLALA